MGTDKNEPGPLPPKANNPAGVTAELPMKRISFISLSEFHLDSPEIFSIVFFNTICIGSDGDALTLIGKSWKTYSERFPKFQFSGA